MTTGPSPVVVDRKRFITLFASLLVALSSGTNYVYSAYAPQLGRRLAMNHTQLNIIGLGGNMGVYSTGPIWGRMVDRRGPTMALVLACLFLFTGYSGIRTVYDTGLPTDGGADFAEGELPQTRLILLVLCGFLSGAGGNGGLTAAINTTAKSFPDRTRATATGLVISGFGLSAFLFSTLAHVLFPGDTSEFLLLLALGTSIPVGLGIFFIRSLPPPSPPSAAHPEHAHERDEEAAARLLADSRLDEDEALTSSIEDLDSERASLGQHSRVLHAHRAPRESVELSPARGLTRMTSRAPLLRAAGTKGIKLDAHGLPDVSGRALWVSSDFWLLFATMSLISGTGLMYINNVGAISQALYANDPDYDEVKAAQWQATQVSTISIANCLGRILIGLTADLAKHRLQLHRVHCLPLVSGLFLCSQLAALMISSVSNLWRASALLGFAYGCMFGLFPMVTLEWFGMAHFSENWGFISLSPMLGGNLFSLAFGRNYDAHAAPDTPDAAPLARLARLAARAGLPTTRECLVGRECYAGSLRLTAGACALALALSVWAGVRDRRRVAAVAAAAAEEERREVVWEGGEE